jgi:hypothetical protein
MWIDPPGRGWHSVVWNDRIRFAAASIAILLFSAFFANAVEIPGAQPWLHQGAAGSLFAAAVTALLVHIQDRFRVMSYGNEHETSYLRTYAFRRGARGAGGRSSLLRSLRTPPLPDTFSQCSRRDRTADSQKPGVRTANGARRHPRLQRARAGCSQSDLLTTYRGPRRLRRGGCALSAGVVTPLSEGIRQT